MKRPSWARGHAPSSSTRDEVSGGDGGVSSTPSLTRCLLIFFPPSVSIVKREVLNLYGRLSWRGRAALPVHCRHGGAKLVLGLLPLREFHVRVDAAGLLEGRDPPAHPRRAARELVVGGEHGPVEGVLQRHEAVDGADGLALEERRQWAGVAGDGGVPVGSVGLFHDIRGPRCRDLPRLGFT